LIYEIILKLIPAFVTLNAEYYLFRITTQSYMD